MDSLHDVPVHLIRRAHQASTALFAAECAGFDLTSMQFAALVAITAPDVDATRLSALIVLSTIGVVPERLEAKGWVLRLVMFPRDEIRGPPLRGRALCLTTAASPAILAP